MTVCAVLLAAGAARAGGGFDGPAIDRPVRVPDFALHDQTGRLIRLSRQRGNVVLLTFLYTHCRDMCPLTAASLNAVLGLSGAHVTVLAVSVDPRGDTQASVRRFVREHHLRPAFHYLRGSRAALQRVWKEYGVSTRLRLFGQTVESHTLYTLLVDRTGRDRVVFDSTASPRAIAHDVRLLLGR
ncbi:MAG TPA: SCO family protein [Gaiellaceae bacterium]|nr:SCO family protein [Gaiellaceae bacterium]